MLLCGVARAQAPLDEALGSAKRIYLESPSDEHRAVENGVSLPRS